MASVVHPEQLTAHATKGSVLSTQTIAGTSSTILSNSQDNHINNNTFVTNIKKTESPLEALHQRVAPNAILNAGGRADEVRCHPGTRKEVISRIERWRADAQDGTMGSRIFWLSGPAGAGKSAIVQTVAESWSWRGIHAANFFFLRSDSSRNHARSLVATLLYQIFEFYPAAREAVEKVLASKPRILEAGIKQQFDQLICSPLRSIGHLFPQPLVLLIDGLDECDPHDKTSQWQILQALDALVGQDNLPFLVLVASRVEAQISMGFKQLSSNVDSMFLDDQYSPENDIRLFVTAEFDRIKRMHHLAPQDENWPSASDVDGIVAKSSGQFIYAATVMRFISDSPASPQLSLRRVQGTVRIASKSPFSQLDALYTYILAQADDQEALKDILHAALFVSRVATMNLIKKFTLVECLSIQGHKYTDSMIESCIADVAAVVGFVNNRLIFYHASFPDYLTDQSRSGAYYFDGDAFDLKIVPLLYEQQYAHRTLVKRHIFRDVQDAEDEAGRVVLVNDEGGRTQTNTVGEDPFADESALSANEPALLPLPQTTPKPRRSSIKVTWWRLLNTAIPLSFGIWKCVLSLKGSSLIPTVIDFVLGVIWALILYWGSVVEAEMQDTWKWFFHNDQKANIWLIVLHLPRALRSAWTALGRPIIP